MQQQQQQQNLGKKIHTKESDSEQKRQHGNFKPNLCF